MSALALVSVLVLDQDEAVAWFCGALGFELVEDAPAWTDDGRPKRWVVVRPPDGGAALLLARAEGARQRAAVGDQHGGRVGFFLRVEDHDAARTRMERAGVGFEGASREERYGRVAVFRDVAGNRWDLLGPPSAG